MTTSPSRFTPRLRFLFAGATGGVHPGGGWIRRHRHRMWARGASSPDWKRAPSGDEALRLVLAARRAHPGVVAGLPALVGDAQHLPDSQDRRPPRPDDLGDGDGPGPPAGQQQRQDRGDACLAFHAREVLQFGDDRSDVGVLHPLLDLPAHGGQERFQRPASAPASIVFACCPCCGPQRGQDRLEGFADLRCDHAREDSGCDRERPSAPRGDQLPDNRRGGGERGLDLPLIPVDQGLLLRLPRFGLLSLFHPLVRRRGQHDGLDKAGGLLSVQAAGHLLGDERQCPRWQVPWLPRRDFAAFAQVPGQGLQLGEGGFDGCLRVRRAG